MSGIRDDDNAGAEHTLDLSDRNAMLSAFLAIAVVPVEPCDPIHPAQCTNVRTNVNLPTLAAARRLG
jgi:hypothetical protein